MASSNRADTVALQVDGERVEVAGDFSLLDVLRDHLGKVGAKDGCSPQGQCGCCTVLVDGVARVACVTPVRRVAGRSVVTIDGLDEELRNSWAAAFTNAGASQCGFCTPGIICRLEALRSKRAAMDRRVDDAEVDRALAAHLCRCTGWRTIHEAWDEMTDSAPAPRGPTRRRELDAASRRASIEGRVPQQVGPAVALGRGGFADDAALGHGALVAVPDGRGGWAVGDTLAAARAVAAKTQGRRSTIQLRYPLDVPPGDWDVTLRTTWVEPGYLETDASWCEPGGEPYSPVANGGAFGGKLASPAAGAARELADRYERPVRVLLSREDVVRMGPKRPPVAAGVRRDGSGVVRVVRTPGIADVIRASNPSFEIEEVDAPGPPTSTSLRAAGWAEAAVLRAGAAGRNLPVRSPEGAVAEAELRDGTVHVRVSCGDPLDEIVLRSYCIGATHMALSWVRSEGLRVDESGAVHDLTIRSFGIVRSADMPPVELEIDRSGGDPVNGSDAVFAAAAAAAWLEEGCPQEWPTTGGSR